MRFVHALSFSLAVLLNFIELSSQFESLPNGAEIPNVPRRGPSYFPEISPPAVRTHFPEELPYDPERIPYKYSPVRLQSPPLRLPSTPDRTPPRERSRSPRRMPPFADGMEHIRLVPLVNPCRLFEVRKYVFPDDAPLRVRAGRAANVFGPMPVKGQKVLVTSTGDVVAVMNYNTVLRGIYALDGKRSRINVYTGEVVALLPEEEEETPLGSHHPIRKNFKYISLNQG